MNFNIILTAQLTYYAVRFYLCTMPWLKHILLLLLVSVSLTAFAQQKEAEQLSNLYKKGSYEKCIKKAERFAESYPNNYQFPLYSAVSYWSLYKADKEITANLINALGKLDVAYGINGKKVNKFTAEQKQLHTEAIKIGPTLLKTGKKSDAAALYSYVASIYKDTTEEYTWLYPSLNNATKVKIAGVDVLANDQPELDPTKSANSGVVNHLLEIGVSFLGLPYKYAGCDPSTGFDCSGFVSYLFKQFDMDLPRSSQALSTVGSPIPLAMVKPGDLLFYGTKKGNSYRTQHVAMVYSNKDGKLAFIHSSSRGVVIDDPDSSSWDYWEKRFLFARRVL